MLDQAKWHFDERPDQLSEDHLDDSSYSRQSDTHQDHLALQEHLLSPSPCSSRTPSFSFPLLLLFWIGRHINTFYFCILIQL
jgi:hypothetical protein